jgi:PAP2 superfamily
MKPALAIHPPAPMDLPDGEHRAGSRQRRALLELGLMLGVYILYCLTRILAANDAIAARGRARTVLHLERMVHLDVESWLNQRITDVAWLAVPMDYWYSVLHYVVTPAVLGWLYLKHRSEYPRARNALVIASGLGLLGYLCLPTAPPRLMRGDAYVDTMAQYAHLGWWSDHASAPGGLGGLTNELAAMPSLHVGWAVWVAWALSARVRGRARPLLALYPLGTALIVVCTGNHWVLDCAVGLLVALAGTAITARLSAAPRRRSDVPSETTSPRSTQ